MNAVDAKHWGMVFLYDSELQLVEQRAEALGAPRAFIERLRVRNTTANWRELEPAAAMEFKHEVVRYVLVADARDPDGQWAAIYRREQ